MNIKELADIGAKAACHTNGEKLYGNLCVNPNKWAYCNDAIHREAFAQAVIDAYCKDYDMLKRRVHELMDENAKLQAAKSRLAALKAALSEIYHYTSCAEAQSKIINAVLPQDAERQEFESWFTATLDDDIEDLGDTNEKNVAWDSWKAARKQSK